VCTLQKEVSTNPPAVKYIPHHQARTNPHHHHHPEHHHGHHVADAGHNGLKITSTIPPKLPPTAGAEDKQDDSKFEVQLSQV
jgi:hypothetical protein